MRIVAFADTHQFHDELRLPPGDVLVCAGDACRAGHRDELDAFLAWFATAPHRHKLFVAGNHDVCLQERAVREEARRAWPGITLLQDEGVVVDGVRFWGSPWTPAFHDWAFMLPRGPALAERWSCIPTAVDVLVTHGPPQGILDDVSGYRGVPADAPVDERRAGCADLAARVRVVRPRLHLFGHIHTGRGVVDDGGTRFVNCTTWEAELPASVVDLDG
jgi:hypothetical protein